MTLDDVKQLLRERRIHDDARVASGEGLQQDWIVGSHASPPPRLRTPAALAWCIEHIEHLTLGDEQRYPFAIRVHAQGDTREEAIDALRDACLSFDATYDAVGGSAPGRLYDVRINHDATKSEVRRFRENEIAVRKRRLLAEANKLLPHATYFDFDGWVALRVMKKGTYGGVIVAEDQWRVRSPDGDDVLPLFNPRAAVDRQSLIHDLPRDEACEIALRLARGDYGVQTLNVRAWRIYQDILEGA